MKVSQVLKLAAVVLALGSVPFQAALANDVDVASAEARTESENKGGVEVANG